MHAEGYLTARRRHPGALVAALGINGAIVIYALSSVTGVTLPDLPTPEWRNIPIITPPPVTVPTDTRPMTREAKPQPQPRTTPSTPETSTTITLTPSDGWPELDRGQAIDPGPVGGGNTAPPAPDPVIVGAQIDARYRGALQPPYPVALQRAEIEGSVTVRVQIGTDGRVIAVELVAADNPGFFATTRDWALKRWRFVPATRDGVPVTSWRMQRVTFMITSPS